MRKRTTIHVCICAREYYAIKQYLLDPIVLKVLEHVAILPCAGGEDRRSRLHGSRLGGEIHYLCVHGCLWRKTSLALTPVIIGRGVWTFFLCHVKKTRTKCFGLDRRHGDGTFVAASLLHACTTCCMVYMLYLASALVSFLCLRTRSIFVSALTDSTRTQSPQALY